MNLKFHANSFGKTIVACFFLLTISNACCQQANFEPLERSAQINLLNILWQVECDRIEVFSLQNSDHFVKVFLLPTVDFDSEYEGETVHQLYVLKGECGEAPDGELYEMGFFYNPSIDTIGFVQDKYYIKLIYGQDSKRTFKEFRL